MATFGKTSGPTYCFGRINVAAAGTPAPLNQNVPFVTNFGASASSAPTMRCTQLVFKAPGGTTGAGGNVANTGNVYICYTGGNRATQNSIIADLAPGQGFTLDAGGPFSPLDPSMYVIDADTNGDGCRVTGVIGT